MQSRVLFQWGTCLGSETDSLIFLQKQTQNKTELVPTKSSEYVNQIINKNYCLLPEVFVFVFNTEHEASVRSLAIETNGKAVDHALQICFPELISIFSFLVLQACPRDTMNWKPFQKLLFLLCATRPL